MEQLFLLITATYAVSLCVGLLFEKYLRMPWMFAALFFGMVLSSFNPFESVVEGETFRVFANLGMLFLDNYYVCFEEFVRIQ